MASTSETKVVYDGSIEREHKPEDITLEQTLKASMETFKEEQCQRDAAMARKIASEYSSQETTHTPYVVEDGSIERVM